MNANSEASDTLLETLRGRRTVHDFLPDLPPQHVVMSALEAACWAPNHRLTEPWRFYLLGPATAEAVSLLNAEVVRRKSGDDAAAAKLRRWRAMPGWLVVTCQRSEDPEREREDYAACSCAIQNFMLALWRAGVGSKWSTGKVTRDPGFLPLIGATPDEFCVGIVWYGYAQSVPAQSRRALTSVLHLRD